jgi:hypothetical protein
MTEEDRASGRRAVELNAAVVERRNRPWPRMLHAIGNFLLDHFRIVLVLLAVPCGVAGIAIAEHTSLGEQWSAWAYVAGAIGGPAWAWVIDLILRWADNDHGWA